MDPILEIAKEHSLKVIEDCAQCHGAVYYSRWPGWDSAENHAAGIEQDGVQLYPRLTGSMGDMAAFSFCQDKIMTTGGEGGMLLTNDDGLWEKPGLLRIMEKLRCRSSKTASSWVSMAP